MIESMDLPPEEHPTSADQPAPSLREFFTPDELAAAGDAAQVGRTSIGSPAAPEPGNTGGGGDAGRQRIGIINTQSAETAEEDDSMVVPTIGQILRGETESEEVGGALSGYNPIRSFGMVLLVLALLFAAAWVARKLKNPLRGISQQTLAVIETVSIGPGRQLVIVEMNDDALVLGVTPHSINMLDKVPLAQLNGSYSRTVNSIIQREENSLPADWSKRPAFDAGELPRPAPPLAAATYGPSGQITVGELRRAYSQHTAADDSAGGGTIPGLRASAPVYHRDTKSELIDKIREQLSELER
jgi:flagellar biosynthetic protein FliO